MGYWYIFIFFVLLIVFLRKDLAREMFIGGLLALPVILIKPVTSLDFYTVALQNGGIFVFLIERILLGFSFGAISTSIYEIFFHKKITPLKHPLRKKLVWLTLGPLLFLLFQFVFGQVLIISILAGFLVDIIVVILIRKDLIWDMLFSGLCMGILFIIIFTATMRGIPGQTEHLWFSNSFSGVNLFSLPVEEIITVFFFGALWGPLYIALKDMKER